MSQTGRRLISPVTTPSSHALVLWLLRECANFQTYAKATCHIQSRESQFSAKTSRRMNEPLVMGSKMFGEMRNLMIWTRAVGLSGKRNTYYQLAICVFNDDNP